MVNRVKLTPARIKKFIKHLKETTNVSEACKVINVSRQTIYNLRDADDDFRDEWDNAIEIGVDALEGEARRRALHGHKEVILYKGEPVKIGDEVLFKKVYSDSLLMFLLKGQRPDKYKERSHNEVTGLGGGAIESRELSNPERANRLVALFESARKAGAGQDIDGGDAGLGADTRETK